MRDHFIGQGQRIADNLARQSTLALLFHSAENARDVVGATLAFPDVAGLQIMDARRKVLLSRVQGNARLDAALFSAMPPSHAAMVGETADGWVFVAPVYGGQRKRRRLNCRNTSSSCWAMCMCSCPRPRCKT
jgi:hypothetical protein